MPKRPQGQRRPADTIGFAARVAKIATIEIEETATVRQPNKAKGGRSGGRARATVLTPERLSEIACAAAASRWEGT